MNDKEALKQLVEKYSPLVRWIIESNQIYTGIDGTVRWRFSWDDDPSITAAVDRKTNVLRVNLAFVDLAYKDNRLYDIEYFLLHEMRHIYQHNQVKLLSCGKCAVDHSIVKKWAEEGENYIIALDKDGKEDARYFKQDCELDAYSFSFAAMSAKYRGIYDRFLFVPDIYKQELKEGYDSVVEGFFEHFV